MFRSIKSILSSPTIFIRNSHTKNSPINSPSSLFHFLTQVSPYISTSLSLSPAFILPPPSPPPPPKLQTLTLPPPSSGRYGFHTFTHLRSICTIPPYLDYLLSFRYPPYQSSNIAKIRTGKPPFKRGEGIKDQRVGRGVSDLLRGWVGWGVWWVGVVVGVGWVDEWVMGGRSGVLGVVRGWWGWER